MRNFLCCMVCAFVCSLMWCTGNKLAGGGLDTESSGGTITGSVKFPDGSAAISARVYCIVSTYNAAEDAPLPDSLIKETNAAGTYRFDRVKQGAYNIQMVSQDEKNSLLATGIDVDTGAVIVPTGTLIGSGTLKILIPPGGGDEYAYLPGTICYARAQDGCATIDDVPAGYIPLLSYVNTIDSTKNCVVKAGFFLSSGAVTTIADPVSGEFSKTLCLNTSMSGADVAGPVYDFPVVVRLNAGNFVFSQARPDGHDIRFTTKSAAPLAYEIERWDPVAGFAEVWVKVDTILGSDTAQSILMYWGNTAAIPGSRSAAVFDTADSYAAVWHVNRNCIDATADGHDGNACSARDTVGLLGMCKKFNGSDSMEIPGLLGSPSGITLSAWAQLDSTSAGSGSEILSIGDAALIRMDYAKTGMGTIGAVHLAGDSTFYNVSSGRFLQQTGWHFITYTVDSGSHTHTLYIDGVMVRSQVDQNAMINYSGAGQNTFIGKHGNGKSGFGFIGRIDEVRVCRAPVSADYIKLCYMNQKEKDALVVFK